jgi:4-hydroxybenzoate polyprenyltransferase
LGQGSVDAARPQVLNEAVSTDGRVVSERNPPEERGPRVERASRRPSALFTERVHARNAIGHVAWALGRQLRPKQWVKNLACLAGLVFSGRLFDGSAQLAAVLAFTAFCLASSCVYIINDFFDRENDRHNPRTASRPLATGELPVWVAAVALVTMLAASLGISATLGLASFCVILIYATHGVLYSVFLKRMVIVDVMSIALGFVLRVMFGVYAVGVLPTPWIVLCMFFLALFLGFAKRQAELTVAEGSHVARPVLSKYRRDYLETLIGFSATTAVLTYALFTVTSHRNPTLVATVVPVIYCICRYLLQVMVAGRGESPDETLLYDPRILAGIAAWVVLYVAISYGDIRVFAELR